MTASTSLAIVVALALGGAGVAVLARLAERLPQATPSDRTLHAGAIPRAGGYAIWLGFLPVALWLPPPFPGGVAGWLPPFLVVLAVSAVDDAREVRADARLLVHLAAAGWCAWSLWRGAHAPAQDAIVAAVAIVATALAIAWSANLYNFMDGSDGLAATMTIIGFGAYGIAAMLASADGTAFFAVAAATLPFLAVNRPRATMFMGDVGSVPLGFLAAAFGFAGVSGGVWPGWFPVLVFLPFLADASVTLARRAALGARLATAHREHYYQRLHRMGAGHAGTLGVYAAAMAAVSALALLCLALAPEWGPGALAAACVVCFILFGAIDYHWRRRLPTPQ
jgi:UDP-N-acetylmuramyl pentapeptide phosphotransferase/UDP-N-acetylglucosamine-1-phosphate transferase